MSLASTVSLHKQLCEATTKSINSKIYRTTVKVHSSEVHRLYKCVIPDFAHFIDLQALLSYTANKSFCITQLFCTCCYTRKTLYSGRFVDNN